jgi:hypothetical protein
MENRTTEDVQIKMGNQQQLGYQRILYLTVTLIDKITTNKNSVFTGLSSFKITCHIGFVTFVHIKQ